MNVAVLNLGLFGRTGRPDGKGASQLLQISESLPVNQLQEAQLKQVAAQVGVFVLLGAEYAFRELNGLKNFEVFYII